MKKALLAYIEKFFHVKKALSSPSVKTATLSERRASAVGMMLQNQRQKLGYTPQQVSEHLRIRLIFVEALEKGDFKALPGLAYASGFLRSYAEYLQLNSAVLVNQFRDEMAAAARQVELALPIPTPENHVPSRIVLAGALAAVVVVSGAWLLWSRSAGDVVTAEEPPALQEEASSAVQDIMAAFSNPLETTLAEPAVPKAEIIITALVDSWIEIRNAQGKKVFSGILKQGEMFDVADKDLSLTTGNAGGLALKVHGQDLPPLGARGKVIRNIALDPQTLLGAGS